MFAVSGNRHRRYIHAYRFASLIMFLGACLYCNLMGLINNWLDGKYICVRKVMITISNLRFGPSPGVIVVLFFALSYRCFAFIVYLIDSSQDHWTAVDRCPEHDVWHWYYKPHYLLFHGWNIGKQFCNSSVDFKAIQLEQYRVWSTLQTLHSHGICYRQRQLRRWLTQCWKALMRPLMCSEGLNLQKVCVCISPSLSPCRCEIAAVNAGKIMGEPSSLVHIMADRSLSPHSHCCTCVKVLVCIPPNKNAYTLLCLFDQNLVSCVCHARTMFAIKSHTPSLHAHTQRETLVFYSQSACALHHVIIWSLSSQHLLTKHWLYGIAANHRSSSLAPWSLTIQTLPLGEADAIMVNSMHKLGFVGLMLCGCRPPVWVGDGKLEWGKVGRLTGITLPM